jgi:hypothetical protein
MAGLSLRQAATEAGTSKSTILRAIQSGRLSAARTDDGGYSIDPAELFRVYPPKSSAVASDQSTHRGEGQDGPASAPADATEVRVRNAQLEFEIKALQAILDVERKRGEELRTERDRWAAQAERLTLEGPGASQRRWWLFRRAG